ncbi:hypothetical protein SH528x_000273 [Novipirellula sp. SH528]|uniref:hypothetical protein n=1 Tax=Novipirellula sp. SH528 TaxID=3454466 RepID=UPI003F9FB9B0
MNTVVLLPDGVGVRNFVLGNFLKLASNEGEVHTLHLIPDDLLKTYSADTNGSVHWHPLVRHRDRPVSSFFRNSLAYAQYYWVDNYPMRVKCRISKDCSLPRRVLLNSAKLLARASASPKGIQRLDRLHARIASRAPEVAHYRELFTRIKPTILFCSHQRPNEILAPVLAAQSLSIPTATFIFSWDNLSSKARIAAPFDHYLVWSQHMHDELIQFYPDITPDRIHVVGTPQFDPYAEDELLWTREEFMRRIGADPARKLICFSGGEHTNAIEDQHHVRALMELIREGAIRGNPQVLLRTCPIDDFSRYDAVRRDFPEMIYAQPEWSRSSMKDWFSALPTENDTQMLTNITKHADLNINFASTMTLDFALRDRPVINVEFDVSNPPVFGMPMSDYIHQYEHYRPVIELGAARYAKSRSQLAEHVNAYLENPTLDQEGRQKFAEMQVSMPLGESRQRIVKTLKQLSK